MCRRTSWSVEELLNEMDNPMSRRCFIVNEIGMACHEGEDKERKGEKMLLSLIENEDPALSLPAYCYLAASDEMAARNAEVLEEWRKKPENKQYLDWVNRKTAENKQ